MSELCDGEIVVMEFVISDGKSRLTEMLQMPCISYIKI